MYIHQCPECGKNYSTQEKVSRVKCPYCGAETNVSYSESDPQHGFEQWGNQVAGAVDSVFNNGPSGKSRGIAGLLAILLGWSGLHYFYLNKTSAGVTFLLASIVSCGLLATVTEVVAIIQGVLFLTSSQEEFERKWVNTPNSFPMF